MNGLEITTEKTPANWVAVSLKGSLDALTIADLEQVVEKLKSEGIYSFVLDLSGITQITSSGAGFFTKLLWTVHEHKGVLLLVQPGQAVKDIFDLIGLSEYLSKNIVPDYATAQNIMNRVADGEIVKGIKM